MEEVTEDKCSASLGHLSTSTIPSINLHLENEVLWSRFCSVNTDHEMIITKPGRRMFAKAFRDSPICPPVSQTNAYSENSGIVVVL